MAIETLRIKSVPAVKVYQEIASRIDRGEYPAGTWLPAERALAQEFGIDRPIVRNALAHLAREGVIVTQRGKRPWVTGSKSTSEIDMPPITSARKIAAIVPQSPHYPAGSAIIHGVNKVARAQEVPPQIVMFDTTGAPQDSVAHEMQALRSVLEDGFSAAILWWKGGSDTLPLIRECQDRGIPIVFVDRYLEDASCDFVGTDNETGVDEAIEYLISLGHTRIAHLTTYEEVTTVRDRHTAYLASLLSAGIQAPAAWTHRLPDTSSASFHHAIELWHSMDEPPTAIFTMNDLLAHLFIVELEQMGLSVPADFSIIGFDDLEQFSPRPALLTSIHQSFDRVGKRAMEVITHRLDAPYRMAAPQHVLLPAPLVLRNTCRSIKA